MREKIDLLVRAGTTPLLFWVETSEGGGSGNSKIWVGATSGQNVATYTCSAIGIGTTTPAVSLHNTGFSMLGDTSPHIKAKLLSGTVPSTNGSYSLILHGLSSSTTILGYSGMIEIGDPGSGKFVPLDLNQSNIRVQVYITDNPEAFTVYTNDAGSLLSKPIRLLVWYSDASIW